MRIVSDDMMGTSDQISNLNLSSTTSNNCYNIEQQNINKKWLCTACGNLYKSKPSLRFHQKVHCGKEPKYNCKFCHRKFFQNSNYKTHVIAHHRDMISKR